MLSSPDLHLPCPTEGHGNGRPTELVHIAHELSAHGVDNPRALHRGQGMRSTAPMRGSELTGKNPGRIFKERGWRVPVEPRKNRVFMETPSFGADPQYRTGR